MPENSPLVEAHTPNDRFAARQGKRGGLSAAILAGALGAIDTALWDIAGKHYGAPVYQLLGGKVRDRVRVQTQIDAPTVDEVVANARREVGRGVTALRFTPFAPDFASMRHDAIIREAVARVGAVREAVGSGIDLGVEIHRRLSPASAIVLAGELEQFRLMYYEDPILPDSVQSCAEVARSTRLPVATGERLHSLVEFRELLACGRARYVRVDPCLAGGLTSAKKIAALAESYHAEVMPHGVLSPVATAISVQLDACITSSPDALGCPEHVGLLAAGSPTAPERVVTLWRSA